MSGSAAVGAAVVGGAVAVTCGTAASVGTITLADGKWTIALTDPTFPCQVSVTGGTLPVGLQLNSVAIDASVAGNVNVTPLTTLIHALMTNSAGQFTLFTRTVLDNASDEVRTQLLSAGFLPPANPLYAAFNPQAGDAHDDLIEQLMLSLEQQGITLTQVAQGIVQSGEAGSAAIVLPSVTAFSTIPADFPANMPSYGFEATGLRSLGDNVVLAPNTPRKLRNVTVGMSSWACQTGGWNTADCVSAADARFSHPVTLKIYNDTGTLLATKTQTFSMPYRPSASTDAACAGKWKAANGTCYNGFAFKISFDMGSLGVTLPNNVRWDVSYNTRSAGPNPLGGATGPYDSLNVGTYALAVNPSVGTDPDPGFLMWNGSSQDEGLGLMADIQTGN